MSFDITRVGGARRGWPPVVIVAFVVILASVVAVGVGGRGPGPTPTLAAVGAASVEPATVTPEPTTVPFATSGARRPLPTPPTVSSDGGPIQLRATRYVTSMFVHGDIYVARVTWVFLSLQDETGQVVGWASVSVPGTAGSASTEVPALRFDVELAIPPASNGRLWVQGQAYDADGVLSASVRLEVPVAGPRPS